LRAGTPDVDMLRVLPRGTNTLKDLLNAAPTATNAAGRQALTQAASVAPEATAEERASNKRKRDEPRALRDAISAAKARLHDVTPQQTAAQVLSHGSGGAVARAAPDAPASQDKISALAALCATVGSTWSAPSQATGSTDGSSSSCIDRASAASNGALGALLQAAANTTAATTSIQTSNNKIKSMSSATSLAWSEQQLALAREALTANFKPASAFSSVPRRTGLHGYSAEELCADKTPFYPPNFTNSQAQVTQAQGEQAHLQPLRQQLPPLIQYLRTVC
jgi:hypothetical protein